MKSILCALILALALLSFVAPWPKAAAQTAGASAVGTYTFTSTDGLPKYVEFDARADEKGAAAGGMTFSGRMVVSEQDAEAAGDPRLSGEPTDFYMKAEFDCLTVSGNRAVMGGVVRESSPKGYAGRRVLLAVEDGDELKAGDGLAWILYDAAAGGWVPQDAERPDDNGATLKWIAKDAERPDDVGVPQPKSSTVVRCQDFPLSSQTFGSAKYEGGDIRVRP
jgi:hypothetical protein